MAEDNLHVVIDEIVADRRNVNRYYGGKQQEWAQYPRPVHANARNRRILLGGGPGCSHVSADRRWS
jgi:hypothetical protein